jgi:hypothetical protein
MSKTDSRSRRRSSGNSWNFLAAGVLFAIISSALPAWAALGGDAASVEADQIHLQGSRHITTAESYNVHEIQAATGTMVREYVSSQGKVFGVAWQGSWPPDMRQLLGSYFDRYVQAVKIQTSSRMGRRPLSIELPGFVVQVGGHGRFFAGRAYIPDQLPASVSAEAIR